MKLIVPSGLSALY